LFLLRPEWLRVATCFSAYGLLLGNMAVAASAASGFTRYRGVVTLYIGAKVYALIFYHWLEYTSATPPEDHMAYWSAESPYLVAMGLVCWRLATTGGRAATEAKKQR